MAEDVQNLTGLGVATLFRFLGKEQFTIDGQLESPSTGGDEGQFVDDVLVVA